MNNFGALYRYHRGWAFCLIPADQSAGITSAHTELSKNIFPAAQARRCILQPASPARSWNSSCASLVLAPILGVDIHIAILITAAVAMVYTCYGGIWRRSWTDASSSACFSAAAVTLLSSPTASAVLQTLFHLSFRLRETGGSTLPTESCECGNLLPRATSTR